MGVLTATNAMLAVLVLTTAEGDLERVAKLTKALYVNVVGFGGLFMISQFQNTGTVITSYVVTAFAHVILIAGMSGLLPQLNLDITKRSVPSTGFAPAPQVTPASQGLNQYYYRA